MFETFFNHEELAGLAKNASTVAVWDFNCALGNSIKERYESLHAKIEEVTAVLVRKGAKGYFWIATSPEMGSCIEMGQFRHTPKKSTPDGQIPMGLQGVTYTGLFRERWRLYIDTEMEVARILIGVNDSMESPKHYARLTIANFIV